MARGENTVLLDAVLEDWTIFSMSSGEVGSAFSLQELASAMIRKDMVALSVWDRLLRTMITAELSINSFGGRQYAYDDVRRRRQCEYSSPFRPRTHRHAHNHGAAGALGSPACAGGT